MKFVPIHLHRNYPAIQDKLKELSQRLLKTEIVLQILFQLQCLNKSPKTQHSSIRPIVNHGINSPFDKKNNGRHEIIFKETYQSGYPHQNRIEQHNHRNFNQHITKTSKQSYRTLQSCYFKEIPGIFSFLAKIVLQTPYGYVETIPILSQGFNSALDLTKQQVVYLIALMALNLVPPQQYEGSSKFNKENSFSFIFQEQQYKTRTIIEYLMYQMRNFNLKEKFSIIRASQHDGLESILLKKGRFNMQQFKLNGDLASIQKYNGLGKVDFANKKIGGGALTKGCVQQEIMFANHPEMYVSILLCQMMRENEALLFIGFKKYSKNSGYSYQTKYCGQQNTEYKSENNRAKEYIIAIDAIDFMGSEQTQFDKSKIDRQIKKAYVGFNMLRNVQSIVTGNWGCGAFKGNIKLKALIQWIACSLAGKKLIYCPYGEQNQLKAFEKFYNLAINMKVQDVYALLIKGAKFMRSLNDDIFQTMFQSTKQLNFEKAKTNDDYSKRNNFHQVREQKYTPDHDRRQKNFSVDPRSRQVYKQQTNKQVNSYGRGYSVNKQNIYGSRNNHQEKPTYNQLHSQHRR